ncbi:neopullulanase [Vibrio variabilis]|uniref:Neopullulanase n=1 Tax=Vibrio variabilis TaxID=990271 RepID=A0ABQ0JJ65_9VIBR|nr:neopullulanase [Vibrio variabilis]
MLWGCSSESTSPTDQGGTTSYACSVDVATASDDLRIYQVMVESFVDGNSAIGHGTGYGTSHHMGDIQGIIDSLDYIQELGMNAIWLTPIFDSVPIDGQNEWLIASMRRDTLRLTTLLSTHALELWTTLKS